MTKKEKQAIYSRRYAEKNPIRKVHVNMLLRCGVVAGARPRDLGYYAKRGISVCPEWRYLAPFREWALSHGYRKGLQLDRIDSSKGYAPDNCRFVTRSENMRNRSNNRKFIIQGKEYFLCDIQKYFPVRNLTFKARVDVLGWTPEEAAMTPLSQHRIGWKQPTCSGGRNPMAKKVRCKETGVIYGAIIEAAKQFGVKPYAIRKSIIKGCGISDKWHFEYFASRSDSLVGGF